MLWAGRSDPRLMVNAHRGAAPFKKLDPNGRNLPYETAMLWAGRSDPILFFSGCALQNRPTSPSCSSRKRAHTRTMTISTAVSTGDGRPGCAGRTTREACRRAG